VVLAARLGVAQSVISRVEGGRVALTLDEIRAVDALPDTSAAETRESTVALTLSAAVVLAAALLTVRLSGVGSRWLNASATLVTGRLGMTSRGPAGTSSAAVPVRHTPSWRAEA
jgi:hypothetical protein